MSTERLSLGRYGEQIAQKYLTACGYEILARNYRLRFGEIDIVARACGEGDGGAIFFEVKTRRGEMFGMPEEAVDRKKIKKILRVAREFLFERDKKCVPQIDVISIRLNMYNMVSDLTHIKNVS